jgi:DNA mismatch repair protein MutS2
MGGKTVALKCIGLLSAMAQSGCPVPAGPGTTLPWLTSWVVDVGDEQSLEQDISTFGAHVRRWAEALEQASPQTLVLLDELGSGTDPAEGAVLAQSVLERLAERGGLGVVTTHLGALKAFAASTPGIRNASMVFDSESRRPTYTLLAGVPGDSHALDMARSLGFPAERVDRARDLLPQGERDVKELLEDLRREREGLVIARRDAEASLARAREAESEAQGRLQRFLEDRAELRAKAARQAREILRRAETQAKEARSAERVRGAAEDPAKRRALQAEARQERARLARLQTRRRHASGSVPRSVAPGEVYWAESLEREVRIVRGADTGGRALVEHGSLKVELPVASLRTVTASPPAGTNGSHGEEPAPPVVRRTVVGIPNTEAVSPEVDLRGMRAEEARSAVEQAVDRGMLASLRELRVIHGKGTGVLQTVVAEFCRTQPAVKSFRLGEAHEGGSGVTVIRLED